MVTDHRRKWAVNLDKCTEIDRWPTVILCSARLSGPRLSGHHLDYPDSLLPRKFTCLHVYWAWPFVFSGCGHCWMKALGIFAGWKILEMTNNDAFMNSFGTLFEVKVPFYNRHIERREKTKHFSYPDYFTYLVSQHGHLGQRCLDIRGCTVLIST